MNKVTQSKYQKLNYSLKGEIFVSLSFFIPIESYVRLSFTLFSLKFLIFNEFEIKLFRSNYIYKLFIVIFIRNIQGNSSYLFEI